jgi:hypothetical protein
MTTAGLELAERLDADICRALALTSGGFSPPKRHQLTELLERVLGSW